jgi:hypothetical protein
LGGFLAGQRNPERQLALALQGGGFDVEAADGSHVSVEFLEFLRAEFFGVSGEDGIKAEFAVRAEELDHLRRGFAHDGFGISLALVVYSCSVELGGRQMCAHTVSLLAASGCNAMSLGYMPQKE